MVLITIMIIKKIKPDSVPIQLDGMKSGITTKKGVQYELSY